MHQFSSYVSNTQEQGLFFLVNFVMMYPQLQPSQEERAKFGYKSERTVDILENPVMFWQPPTTQTTPTTKCPNMVTSMFFSEDVVN
jgi:hypothetical protein